MPEFKRPDGSKITISAKSLIRARASLRNEIYERPGAIGTALFSPKQLVMDQIDAVGPALRAEQPGFARLRSRSGAAIWFDATRSGDAESPRPTEATDGVNAVVQIGRVRQRVAETVAEAQAIIDAARGI
ncbi:MAG: hypothetical protein ACWA5A_16720 [Marinibacterium sp.]